MTAIILHGAARHQFGPRFDLNVSSPQQALRHLLKLVPGFRKLIESADWRIIRGPTKSAVKQGRDCGEIELQLRFGTIREMHLVPVPRGAKPSGIGKIVAGVVILALTIVTAGAFGAFAAGAAGLAAGVGGATVGAGLGISYASVAMAAVGIIAAGVSQVISGTPEAPKMNDVEDPTQRVNFLFNGPQNVVKVGQAVPLVFGRRVLAGSVPITAGLTTENIPVN